MDLIGLKGIACYPLDLKNIIIVKCDMRDGAIILKYDTVLMTSEQEVALACFVFTVAFFCPSISTFIMTLF
jgi:hypothetical protein